MWPDDFNFDFPDFNWSIPELSWDFGAMFDPSWTMPSWDFGGDFGFGFDPSWFNFDPLALPTMPGFESFFAMPQGGNMPDFSQFGVPMPEFQGIGGGAPLQLSDALGFSGGAAPDMALPGMGDFMQGTDPMPNLMMDSPDLAAWEQFLPETSISQTSVYGSPGMVPGSVNRFGPENLGLGLSGPENGQTPVPASLYGGTGTASPTSTGLNPGGMARAQEVLESRGGNADLGQMLMMSKMMGGGGEQTPGWQRLLMALGPTALGAAGLGLQAVNRPERNPLEDDLARARIASIGNQDALAKERLQFERDNAAAMREFQERMQSLLLEARKPGGAANIEALLKSQPQLAALYNALTASGTGLASGSGSPEFQAMIEQIAQVDIAELRRQADQQKAQAMEMAARQGINPANIIAEVEQRFLQESARARANARNTLIAQLVPGINIFNGIGGLFGGLFQTPATA